MKGGHTYAIKERGEDDFATTIEKSNVVVEFTPRELYNDIARGKKLVTELKAKIDLAQQKCDNIEHHHPFVKDMSLADLFTCHMYYEQKVFLDKEKGLQTKLDEIQAEVDFMEEEFKKIAEVTGLDILPKTKEEAVETAVGKALDALNKEAEKEVETKEV